MSDDNEIKTIKYDHKPYYVKHMHWVNTYERSDGSKVMGHFSLNPAKKESRMEVLE